MTQYMVHLYRVMRLTFEGIEAESSEAAALIARDKLTSDADDIADCDGESLSALVDVVGDREYRQSRVIDFEGEKERRAAASLLASLRAVLPYAENECRRLGACFRRDRDETVERAYEACEVAVSRAHAAITEATGGSPPGASSGLDIPPTVASAYLPGGERPYSVLLLYPDYANDSGTETFYAFVEAVDPLAAIAAAKRQAVAAQTGNDIEPDDFAPLLVIVGHQFGEPMFDK